MKFTTEITFNAETAETAETAEENLKSVLRFLRAPRSNVLFLPQGT